MKRWLTWTDYATPLMTLTTDLGLSIYVYGRGRRLVELTDGCYSGGDSQGLPGFIHPRVLGIPTISFQ